MPIRITAAICTHNRVGLLPAAIESLLAQSLPPTDYEILVIDNASTDETPQIMQGYLTASRIVTLRSAVQPVLGLSHARNLAVKLAAGEIIAFMDDDTVAHSGWLEALLEAYATYPGAWAAGGKVLPVWDGERPVWLVDHLLPQLSLLDLGCEATPLSRGQELYGANCSFHRAAFERVGFFRTDLGRHGSELMGSEETELQARIRRQNKLIVYTPEALVWHRISAARMRRRYFVGLAFYKGRTRARLIRTNFSYAKLLQHIAQKGMGVVRQWLNLGLNPFDPTRQIQCLRTTTDWFGLVFETASFKREMRQ